jgi:hypothetical protein
MSDGKGCKCFAYGKYECGCGADWTPQEIYDLRERVKELEAELKNHRQYPLNQFLDQLTAQRDELKEKLALAVEALEDIKYHADNPFATKNGEMNRKWLAYCQDVAAKALKKIEGEK